MMSSIQISDRQHSTMSVNSYSFVTVWKIEASLSEVWNVRTTQKALNLLAFAVKPLLA